MSLKDEFENLLEKLKTERDEIEVRLHLASLEAKEEFDAAEHKWSQIKQKAAEITDDTVETSEEYIAKAKFIGEELKETYSRIVQRLSQK